MNIITKKRNLLELIDIFYEVLSKDDEIFLSSFRELEDSNLRIYYPTNKRIFEIIKAIQDRPYIYIKEPNEKNILLKLSSHGRDPKTRYVQIDDVMKTVKNRADYLKKTSENANPSDYKIIIEQYQTLIENTINEMGRLRDRDMEYIK